MSRMLELPDEVYEALEQAAKINGMTPVSWIATYLSTTNQLETSEDMVEPQARTLADLFAGRIGRIHSGGQEVLSEECGTRFAEYLEEKRHGGQL